MRDSKIRPGQKKANIRDDSRSTSGAKSGLHPGKWKHYIRGDREQWYFRFQNSGYIRDNGSSISRELVEVQPGLHPGKQWQYIRVQAGAKPEDKGRRKSSANLPHGENNRFKDEDEDDKDEDDDDKDHSEDVEVDEDNDENRKDDLGGTNGDSKVYKYSKLLSCSFFSL